MANHQTFGPSAVFARPFTYGRLSRDDAFSSRHPLAIALSATLFAAPLFAAETLPSNPDATQTWPVQVCDDATGPGSLRYIANHAQSGDTIDFSQLPTTCGMRDSTITLGGGEVVLHQASISLVGPLPGDGSVTLSGGGASRVLKHQGYSPFLGTLTVQNLRISGGYVHASGDTGGGCIYSDSNVFLLQSEVAGCTAKSDTGSAFGGGIDAFEGAATLVSSAISGNTVQVGTNGNADGGGVSTQALQAKYSQIENNHAQGDFAHGGGTSSGTVSIAYSTFAGNISDSIGGGVAVATNLDSTIRNSTFSGNHSTYSGGAIHARPDNLHIYNSTIANNSIDTGHGGGLYVSTTTSAQIESTIIANNSSTPMADDADLYLKNGMLTGGSNAIMSSNVHPAGFISVGEDPKLAPLAWIGGPTRTHGMLPGSPLIGIGNNVANLPFEQRGGMFPRTTGPMATVDIGAIQFDDRIFASDLDEFFF